MYIHTYTCVCVSYYIFLLSVAVHYNSSFRMQMRFQLERVQGKKLLDIIHDIIYDRLEIKNEFN